jgi:thiol:disulfide interchange protein/DsbC/DsbD-like thiol-disulfide interchange protein
MSKFQAANIMKTLPMLRLSDLSTFFAALIAGLSVLGAEQAAQAAAAKVQIELLAETSSVRPGDKVTVALRQRITPGWHTYWINPGDSGEPTRIEWQLPAGASAGPIEWPVPEAIPVGPMTNFGYSEQVMLLTEITVPTQIQGQSFEIVANAKWLVCEQICIPEEGIATLDLPLVDPAITPLSSRDAGAIAAARRALPQPMPWPADFDTRGQDLTLRIKAVSSILPPGGKIRFFPLEWGHISHAAPQRAFFSQDDLILQVSREPGSKSVPVSLPGVLAVETAGADGKMERRGYSISASPAASPIAVDETPATAQGNEAAASLSLIMALVFALAGGLILNLMPCVFPVLSLKALSLAKDAGDADLRRRKGLVYLGGVLASFLLIAVVLMSLRMGGTAIGWGMQFQSPGFVLVMMALFLALGLKLSGVFTLGGSVAGIGDGLTRRSGLSGDFFTGVLATIVATPCTAPFMGAAMGYAFVQPAPVLFAVLLALGVGFALPILLLSWSPALGRWLPRPGAWMESFKQLMAFPLYATVGWLLWVLSVQLGSDGVLAGVITLIGVAFAAWLLGRNVSAGLVVNGLAALVAVAAIGIGLWSLGGAAPREVASGGAGAATGGPKSQAFSRSRLDALLAEKKPVFVNLTAAWCITCKVNERVALRSGDVAQALTDRGVTYLVGDWTNGNPEITALLKEHGRVGVPLYLLYSGIPGDPPKILPQLLTETIVVDHLTELKPQPLKQAKGDL